MSILGTFLGKLIFTEVKNTILKSTTPVDNNRADEVAARVTEDLAPRLQHQTNNEPWFRSRVTWGSIAAAFTAVGGMIGMFANGDFDPALAAQYLTVLLGGGFALWGRWVAKKPL